MTMYVAEGPIKYRGIASCAFTMPGKRIEMEPRVYEAMCDWLSYYYRDYKTPADHAAAMKQLQDRINSLQSSLASSTAQCNQANAACAKAEAHSRRLEVDLQIEKQRNTALTEETQVLMDAKASLTEQLEQITQELLAARAETEEAKQALPLSQRNIALLEAKVAEQVEIIDGLKEGITAAAQEHTLKLKQAEDAFKAEKERFFNLLMQAQATSAEMARALAAQRGYGQTSSDSGAY